MSSFFHNSCTRLGTSLGSGISVGIKDYDSVTRFLYTLTPIPTILTFVVTNGVDIIQC